MRQSFSIFKVGQAATSNDQVVQALKKYHGHAWHALLNSRGELNWPPGAYSLSVQLQGNKAVFSLNGKQDPTTQAALERVVGQQVTKVLTDLNWQQPVQWFTVNVSGK
jgi:hypothetical protein